MTADATIVQRFYASSYGRFNTPDPYAASGGPGDPGSWNRYSYIEGDPINFTDPGGMAACHQDDDCPKPRPTYAPPAVASLTVSDMILSVPHSMITLQEYDDEHQTPALERAKCLRDLVQDVTKVKNTVDAKIAEEFKPFTNITSLSAKEAAYFAYKGAKGALGEAVTTDATLGQ